MKYLLLTKHVTPSDPCKVGWETFDDQVAAVQAMERMKKVSEQYGWMAGMMAPGLLEVLLFKVEEVVP